MPKPGINVTFKTRTLRKNPNSYLGRVNFTCCGHAPALIQLILYCRMNLLAVIFTAVVVTLLCPRTTEGTYHYPMHLTSDSYNCYTECVSHFRTCWYRCNHYQPKPLRPTCRTGCRKYLPRICYETCLF